MDITKNDRESKKLSFDSLIVIMLLEQLLGTETIIKKNNYVFQPTKIILVVYISLSPK